MCVGRILIKGYSLTYLLTSCCHKAAGSNHFRYSEHHVLQ